MCLFLYNHYNFKSQKKQNELADMILVSLFESYAGKKACSSHPVKSGVDPAVFMHVY